MLSAHKSDDVMVAVDSTSSLYLIVQSYECSTIMRWVWVVTISKMPACAYRHVLIEISAFFDRTWFFKFMLAQGVASRPLNYTPLPLNTVVKCLNPSHV